MVVIEHHRCSFTNCKAVGAPEAMFNIALGDTRGRLVVLCRKHANKARREKIRVFLLAATLSKRERRRQEREETRDFFRPFKEAFKKAEEKRAER